MLSQLLRCREIVQKVVVAALMSCGCLSYAALSDYCRYSFTTVLSCSLNGIGRRHPSVANAGVEIAHSLRVYIHLCIFNSCNTQREERGAQYWHIKRLIGPLRIYCLLEHSIAQCHCECYLHLCPTEGINNSYCC